MGYGQWLIILWGLIALLLLAGIATIIDLGFRKVLAAIAELQTAIEKLNKTAL